MSNFWSRVRGATSRVKREPAGPTRTAQAVRSCADDEDVAALLDGRLSEHARAEIISHLATSDEAYEVFASAAVILAEGDALLEEMQTPEARAAARRAFGASPDDLRKAAMEAARGSEG